MAKEVKFKRTSISGKKPLPTDLEVGELAINLADQVLYTKNTNDEVILLSGSITAPEGSSGVLSVDGRTGIVTLADLYSALGHTHLEADITDLDKYTQAEVDAAIGAIQGFSGSYTDLTNVPATFTPSAHSHTETDITDLDKYTKSEVDGMIAGVTTFSGSYDDLTEVPTEFTPSAHTHLEADITDLDKYTVAQVDSALALKQDSATAFDGAYGSLTGTPTEFTPSAHTHTESQITDLDKYTQAEVDSALSLKQDSASAFDGAYGSLTGTPTDFTPSAHTHVKSDITDFNDADYATSAQGALADTAVQPGDLTPDAVTTVHGRTGDVVSDAADYSTFYANITHTHTESEITDLDKYTKAEVDALIATGGDAVSYNDLTDVPTEFTPSVHTHLEADITDLDKYTQAEVDAAIAGVATFSGSYNDLTEVPTEFNPSAHTHLEADITDLDKYTVAEVDSALSLKQDSATAFDGAYGSLTGTPTEFTPSVHTHTKSQITDFNEGDYATSAQGATADSALQSVPVSTETTFGGFKHTFVDGVLNLITV